jgi:hypothetical protein
MKSVVLVRLVAIVLAISPLSDELAAQQQTNAQDPVAVMQQLLNWQMQDTARRRLDRQKELIRKEREEAYDRQICARAGYLGPDLDQCVRASADYRTHVSDFSAWETPGQSAKNRGAADCVMLGDGLGGGITECN